MGLIRTLVDYGQQAYEGLKPPAAARLVAQPTAPQEEVNYPQIKLSGQEPAQPRPKVELKNFQQQLGQDAALVQNTLRQKLAEYGLPGHTQIQVFRDETGNFKLKGNTKPDTAQKIEFDLNQNPDFKQQFLRLAQHRPTLDYLQNINRIKSTYGGENQVLNSLLSENPANNSLQAIAQRFDRLNKASGLGDSVDFTDSQPAPVNQFSVAV